MVIAVASANGAGEPNRNARLVLSLNIAVSGSGRASSTSTVFGLAAVDLNALHHAIIGEYASESCWMPLEHVMSLYSGDGCEALGAEVAAVLIPGGHQRPDQRLQRDVVAFFHMDEDDMEVDAATSRVPTPELYVLAKPMFNETYGRDFLRRAATGVLDKGGRCVPDDILNEQDETARPPEPRATEATEATGASQAMDPSLTTSSRDGSVKFGALQAIRGFMEETMGGWHEQTSLVVRDVSSTAMAMDMIPDETLEALNVFPYQHRWYARGHTKSRDEILSLFEFLSRHLITRPGKQLLRQNLKQPLRDVEAIRRRQDAIEEFTSAQNQLLELQTALREVSRTMPGVDVLCRAVHGSAGDRADDRSSTRWIATLTSSLIQLHEFCEGLRLIEATLASFKSARLVALRAMFEKSKTSRAATSEALLALFERHVVESFTRSDAKRSQFMSKSQQIFALKTTPSTRLLEIHRARFTAGTEKVKEMAARLRATYPAECGTLAVKYAAGRGFFFCVNPGGNELPPESGLKCLTLRGTRRTHGTRNARGTGRGSRSEEPTRATASIQVTCEELNALNVRIDTASNECLRITRDILLHHLSDLLEHHLIPLISTQDAIAELDMLSGLAWFAMVQESGASESFTYVRPLLTHHGPALVIQDGRHPMLERQLQDLHTAFVPNDTMLADDCSACILTGANALGKSVYLKQNALCVLLAQTGSLVPASFMSLTPFSGISLIKETNSAKQLQQIERTIQAIRSRTPDTRALGTQRGHLVLVDEVCDVASDVSRLALSWALVEEFLVTNTMAIVATHVTSLSKLADLYPNARALMVDPQRKIRNGTICVGGYGIELAKRMGFPSDTIDTATQLSASLLEQVSRNVHVQDVPSLPRERAILKAYSRIQCLEELQERGIATDVASALVKVRSELRE